MANYIVSYDLNGSTPTHAQMDKHMETAGWARGRVLETVWYVGTAQSEDAVYEHVNAILSTNDRVIVATTTSASFRNLLVGGDSLKSAWSRNS